MISMLLVFFGNRLLAWSKMDLASWALYFLILHHIKVCARTHANSSENAHWRCQCPVNCEQAHQPLRLCMEKCDYPLLQYAFWRCNHQFGKRLVMLHASDKVTQYTIGKQGWSSLLTIDSLSHHHIADCYYHASDSITPINIYEFRPIVYQISGHWKLNNYNEDGLWICLQTQHKRYWR